MVFGPNRQEGIKRVMDPPREHWRAVNQVCERLVRWLVVPYAPQLLRALEMLGLQWRTVPEPWTRRCELFLGLLERYGSDGEAATGMAADGTATAARSGSIGISCMTAMSCFVLSTARSYFHTSLSECRGIEGRSAAENQQVDEVYDIYWRTA
jgi:hypothetical protein